MNASLICIVCPVGCNLDVTYDRGRILTLTGNLCPRGEIYAEKELFDPERTLTTSVKVAGGEMPLASVRTVRPIPRPLVMEVVKKLRKLELEAPVEFGQVVMKDVDGKGTDVIATRAVGRGRGRG